MSRDLEVEDKIIEVESGGEMKRFKIVEQAVDPPNTIKRTLVPVDTTENDIPVGARLLDERETEGHLARASKPDDIRVGDMVRRKATIGEQDPKIIEESSIKGSVDAMLTSGQLRVRFENGVVERFEAKDLAKVW